MRQYQAIWNRIKTHKKATIIAPNFKHAKIIQAVMKERSADLAFRRLLQKNHIKMELKKEVDIEKGMVHFSLIEISGIQIGDL